MTKSSGREQRAINTIVPRTYNSLEVLETTDRIRTLFARVRGFLKEGGYFLFTERRTREADYEESERVVFDWMDKHAVDVGTGLSVASRLVCRYDRASNRIVNHRLYRIRRPDGSVQNVDFVVYAPVITVAEYMSMLKENGFAVNVSDGYTDLPDGGMNKEVCFSCRPEPPIALFC